MPSSSNFNDSAVTLSRITQNYSTRAPLKESRVWTMSSAAEPVLASSSKTRKNGVLDIVISPDLSLSSADNAMGRPCRRHSELRKLYQNSESPTLRARSLNAWATRLAFGPGRHGRKGSEEKHNNCDYQHRLKQHRTSPEAVMIAGWGPCILSKVKDTKLAKASCSNPVSEKQSAQGSDEPRSTPPG